MPYIAAADRPPLDAKVDALADEIASRLSEELNGDTEVSVCYREAFLEVADAIRRMQGGKRRAARGNARLLALEILKVAEKHGQRGAWTGGLDYALTRLIQVVPAKMVERKAWKEEFRFWVYAQTAGALERAAMIIGSRGGGDWVSDALIGVLIDAKDEYKRRVNSAYEAVQLTKSGDCFTTRFRTEIVEVKDAEGGVVGYGEIMKDLQDRNGERKT